MRVAALRRAVADTSLSGVRRARSRLRAASWSVGQCALAAASAWLLAQSLFGHDRPTFAAVAAVVCLGTRTAQRLRRVAELAVGVSVGVLVGDLLAGIIGRGTWQIGFVVAVALLLAVALDGGALLVSQSGVQAVFVVALPADPGGELARWQDALLGGAVALAVAALLPADPWRPARRSGRAACLGLGLALRTMAGALRDGDVSGAGEALVLARDTQAALDSWAAELAAGHEVARLSPLRRDPGGRVFAQLAALQVGIDRATGNTRVLVRRLLSALQTGEALPSALPELLEGYAGLLDRVVADPDDEGLIRTVTAYGERLVPALGHGSLSATVALAQLRTAVVDLLTALGLPHERARDALPVLGVTVEPPRSPGERHVGPGPGSSSPGERP